MAKDYQLRVAFGDTDAAGIVFYPNFYVWMDRAAHEFLLAIGLDPVDLFENKKIAVPLLETHCSFRSPAKFHDIVRIRTTAVEGANKTFKLTHDFYRGETLLASGYEVRAWVYFGDGQFKAVPIPDEVRAKLTGRGG